MAAEDLIFRAAEAAVVEEITAELFDEIGYLRLNADVQRAVDLGLIESGYAHYLKHGIAENRPLPDMPRESRNVMLTSSSGGRAIAPVTEPRFSIDALIIAPAGGLMIVGWIDDAQQPLNCIRIVGPDWRVVLDGSRFMRVRRADVESAIGAHEPHAYGFFGFLCFEQRINASGPVTVELWRQGGLSNGQQYTPTIVEDVELRNTALAHLASASFFGNTTVESMACLDGGIGAELIRSNKAITKRIVANPYLQRFGPQGRSPRGTIVVCLYGKPEFFFLQQALFSGLPGIEDYEFIYVSNSPEMAEVLLGEAHSANLTYGLTTSVVILRGNAGFGAANNVAAQAARSDRLLFVNPDVFPRDPEWAQKHSDLVQQLPAAQTQLFGVPLYYDDGSLMHGGIYLEVDTGLSMSGGKPSVQRMCRTEHYGKGSAGPAQFTRSRPVPAVTGAFISMDRPWFEHLGGFTEDFIYGHYEDVDLSLRSLGRGVAPWLHDVRLWHLEGKGSTRQLPHEGGSMVNRWLFSRTWLPTIDAGLVGPAPSHPLLQSPSQLVPTIFSDEPVERGAARQRRSRR